MTTEQLAALKEVASKAEIGDSHLANAAHIAAFDPTTCLELLEEVERLKRGEFTPEEFQNLCHNTNVQAGFDAFADGCEAYQQKMFSRCRRGEAQ